MRRDAEMEDPTTSEIEHDKYEEQLESNRRNDREVDGDGLVGGDFAETFAIAETSGGVDVANLRCRNDT
jgi:hypothetical protein